MLTTFERGIGLDHCSSSGASGLEQRHIGLEIRIAQLHTPRLPGPRQLSHAALVQIELGDFEAVIGLAE